MDYVAADGLIGAIALVRVYERSLVGRRTCWRTSNTIERDFRSGPSRCSERSEFTPCPADPGTGSGSAVAGREMGLRGTTGPREWAGRRASSLAGSGRRARGFRQLSDATGSTLSAEPVADGSGEERRAVDCDHLLSTTGSDHAFCPLLRRDATDASGLEGCRDPSLRRSTGLASFAATVATCPRKVRRSWESISPRQRASIGSKSRVLAMASRPWSPMKLRRGMERRSAM